MNPRTLQVTVVPVTPIAQNCSIITDVASKTAVVVDPGGDVPRILKAVNDLGVSIKAIWLTHGHIDHAGGAAELKEALDGIPIEGPGIQDRYLLDALPAKGREFGILGARAVTPDRWLAEGDALTIGDLTFSVLHVPGHSPGSMVFFNDANRFALVGDTLFKGSVGRTDMPNGDHQALIRGIRAKLFPLGDDVTFLCGHGPHGSIGEERRSNPFAGEV